MHCEGQRKHCIIVINLITWPAMNSAIWTLLWQVHSKQPIQQTPTSIRETGPFVICFQISLFSKSHRIKWNLVPSRIVVLQLAPTQNLLGPSGLKAPLLLPQRQQKNKKRDVEIASDKDRERCRKGAGATQAAACMAMFQRPSGRGVSESGRTKRTNKREPMAQAVSAPPCGCCPCVSPEGLLWEA